MFDIIFNHSACGALRKRHTTIPSYLHTCHVRIGYASVRWCSLTSLMYSPTLAYTLC